MADTLMVITDEETKDINQDEMLEIIEHDLSKSRPYHDDVMADIDRWMKEYHGEPYGNEEPGRAEIVWKLIKKQGESLISNIIKPFSGNYDIVELTPITEADVYKTKINEKLINHFWNKEFEPLHFLKTLGKVMVPEGTVFIRVGWEHEVKEKRTKIPLEAFTDEMRERLGSRGAEFNEVDGEIEIIVRKILSNKPTAKVVRNEDIYVDPTADSLEEAKFIIYEMRTSLGDIVKDDIYDEDAVKRLKKIIFNNDDRRRDGFDLHDYNESDFTFMDEARYKVKLYEYWGDYDIEGDGHLEPVVATMAEYSDGEEKHRLVLRMERNPFPFKRPPFVSIVLYEDPFKIHGKGLSDIVGDEQKLSTSIVRGIIDNMAMSNNGIKFFKKGALDPVNWNRLKRGDRFVEVNTTDSITASIMDGNFNQLPQHVYGMLQMLDVQAESLTGISKMMQGIPGSEIKSSASNFSAMMTQSQIRLLDIVNNINQGLKKIFRMWLEMSVRYIDNDEIKRITGIDVPAIKEQETRRLAKEFGIDQLPEDTAMKAMMLVAQEVEDMFSRKDLKYDIKIKVGTDGLKQIKIQNLNMLMQQLAPLAETGSVPPDAIKLLVADLADQLDRPDISQMITQYTPPPPSQEQQMAMQLQMAKLEAEVTKDKALAANAIARTQNVGAKTQKELASMDADISNKYADVYKKMSETDQGEMKAKAEAGSKRAKAIKDVVDASRPKGGTSGA